jgi:hypothetical protein
MSKLDELIESYGEDYAARRAKAKKNVVEVFDAIFEEIPDLKFIRMIGYTPGFNDGDPCTHEMLAMVDGYGSRDLLEGLADQYYDEDEVDYEAMLEDHPELKDMVYIKGFSERKWNDETNKVEDVALNEFQTLCMKAHKLLYAINDDLEIVYGTDWQITLTRTDSSYTIDVDHYSCGY